MAEDAGNKAGLLTAATAPIAMGASSFMALMWLEMLLLVG